jgi:hypothetical protein
MAQKTDSNSNSEIGATATAVATTDALCEDGGDAYQ